MVQFAGHRLVNFGSNDYLGLARSPKLAAAATAAIKEYGVGAGASRLLTGTHPPHKNLEDRLARFKGTESALTFTSGYAAAVGVIPALMGGNDVVIADKFCHACLIDGIRLSGAVVRIYPHNHLGKLESHLRWAETNYPENRVLVVTESIFSMDGDAALLRETVELKDRFGALLLVDEAHALGIIGPGGRGLVAELDLAERVEVQMGTLSKALGASGGYVAGSQALIQLVLNRARSIIYSTAPPPMIVAAALAALNLVDSQEGEERRLRLRARIHQLEESLPEQFKRSGGCGSIFPILIGGEALSMEAAALARENGLLVPAVRFPTVPKNKARLRASLTADHTEEQIDMLTAFLKRLATKLVRRGEV